MPQSDEPAEYPYAFDWTFLDPARAQYEALGEVDRIAFDRLVDFLCEDPWEDGNVKTVLELDDGCSCYLFDDNDWQIIYLPLPGHVLEIWSLDRI